VTHCKQQYLKAVKSVKDKSEVIPVQAMKAYKTVEIKFTHS